MVTQRIVICPSYYLCVVVKELTKITLQLVTRESELEIVK